MPRVPLSDIALEEDEAIVEGFEGELEGIRIWVTAVLERTCVYEAGDLERRLVSKTRVMVEPAQVPIRRRRIGPPGSDMKGRGRPAARTGAKAAAAPKADDAIPEEPSPEDLVEEPEAVRPDTAEEEEGASID